MKKVDYGAGGVIFITGLLLVIFGWLNIDTKCVNCDEESEVKSYVVGYVYNVNVNNCSQCIQYNEGKCMQTNTYKCYNDALIVSVNNNKNCSIYQRNDVELTTPSLNYTYALNTSINIFLLGQNKICSEKSQQIYSKSTSRIIMVCFGAIILGSLFITSLSPSCYRCVKNTQKDKNTHPDFN